MLICVVVTVEIHSVQGILGGVVVEESIAEFAGLASFAVSGGRELRERNGQDHHATLSRCSCHEVLRCWYVVSQCSDILA